MRGVDDGNQQVRRQRLPGQRMREFETTDQHRAERAFDIGCLAPVSGRQVINTGYPALGSIWAVLERVSIGRWWARLRSDRGGRVSAGSRRNAGVPTVKHVGVQLHQRRGEQRL
jgi:hypothetical protein